MSDPPTNHNLDSTDQEKSDPSEDPTEETTTLSIVEGIEDSIPKQYAEEWECPITEIAIELETDQCYEDCHYDTNPEIPSPIVSPPTTTRSSSRQQEGIHVGLIWLFIFLFLASIYGFIWVMFRLGKKQPSY